MPAAPDDNESDEEEQRLEVMRDLDEDEDGPGSNHTLKLAPATIVLKSEVFCLAFSDDGRYTQSRQIVNWSRLCMY